MNDSHIVLLEETNKVNSKEEQQPANHPSPNTDKNDADAFWRMYPLQMSLTAGA